MSLAVLAFLAGVLSVLAPCVLPVLPVMLGGGLSARARYRPIVIGVSTAVCITLFTVLLKVSTAFINVPEGFRLGFSATIIVVYGLTLVFPHARERFSYKLGLTRANTLATKAQAHQGIRGDILLGAAFGPIFASCSPTYFILLSLIFPQSIAQGILYTLVYSLGFVLFLLIIIYAGRALIQRLRRAVNPYGRFKRVLGIVLVLVGVLIATGLMKKIETGLLESGFWDITKIEQRLIDKVNFNDMDMKGEQACFKSNEGVYNCSGSAVNSADTIFSQDPRRRLLNANYNAPEFEGLQNWINTTGWASIDELKGKVVIIDFRTYSCINCIRTLPYLRQLHETYADDGLVIVGIHAPEFQFEKNIKNVRDAVQKFELEYPVVQDNDFMTRRNYNNLYRPAKYIVDKQGIVRYTHFGEGKYEETEEVVQYLLGLHGSGVLREESRNGTLQQTPETYLGTRRRDRLSAGPSELLHERWIEGKWAQDEEKIIGQDLNGSITINAYAKEVNLVLGSEAGEISADIYIDGIKEKTIQISDYALYNLVELERAGAHRVEVRFHASGVMAYAYTFG